MTVFMEEVLRLVGTVPRCVQRIGVINPLDGHGAFALNEAALTSKHDVDSFVVVGFNRASVIHDDVSFVTLDPGAEVYLGRFRFADLDTSHLTINSGGFRNVRLAEVWVEYMTLKDCSFRESTFLRVDFIGCHISGLFSGCVFTDCTFTDCTFERTVFSKSTFVKTRSNTPVPVTYNRCNGRIDVR